MMVLFHSCRGIRTVRVRTDTGAVAPSQDVPIASGPQAACIDGPHLAGVSGGFAVAWSENVRPEELCLPVTTGVFLQTIRTDGTFDPKVTLWP
jgi:hypothetical protein